ncbi:unnamed protein product [Miscanthus lutarioriparius]|uniref:Leucine-rich repeat-containing N-terminal plant-type domain-containing protein n=1 Tax=Miscanthus lutarioriparius TaxID=422564 RepID=A0A811S874_9POAL|nr:unnamed protein product [Miscanthus lutarioriparius]
MARRARAGLMVLVPLLLLPLGALAVAAAAGTDRDALLAFKAGVSDPTGKLLWWNDAVHFCRWPGVSCTAGRVTSLDVSGHGVTGKLSPAVGDLTHLKVLNLTDNVKKKSKDKRERKPSTKYSGLEWGKAPRSTSVLISRVHRSEPRSVGSAIEFRIEELAHEHRTRLQVTMKVEHQLALILKKLDEQSQGISETNRRLTGIHESVAELTAAKADFDHWRPKVDGQVVDLRDCIDNFRQQLDELKSSSPSATPHLDGPGSASLKVPGSAHLDPSSSKAAPGPFGHDDATHHRIDSPGVVYTLEPPPIYKLVVDRFDRDQFNHFIRQFFHVKQSGPVLDYITLFDDLMHQLLAHDPLVNPAILTSKFVDGLKPEIRAAVLLHRPKDLDTESSLAILQEDVLSGHVPREYKKLDSSYSSYSPKHTSKT